MSILMSSLTSQRVWIILPQPLAYLLLLIIFSPYLLVLLLKAGQVLLHAASCSSQSINILHPLITFTSCRVVPDINIIIAIISTPKIYKKIS